jgi:hypothetical protein
VWIIVLGEINIEGYRIIRMWQQQEVHIRLI